MEFKADVLLVDFLEEEELEVGAFKGLQHFELEGGDVRQTVGSP